MLRGSDQTTSSSGVATVEWRLMRRASGSGGSGGAAPRRRLGYGSLVGGSGWKTDIGSARTSWS